MKTLEACRQEIDAIDEQLLALLNRRMEVVEEVGHIKNSSGAPIYRPEREKAIIKRLTALNKGLLNEEAIAAIFLEIFAVSRNIERPERIAYLGPEGSFTHQAAESRFGAMSEYLSMGSIVSVFKALAAKRVKYGVVPIENARDGVVGETLDLLANSSFKIVSELYMPIHMTFSTLAESVTRVKRIYSKDKGFGQCREFLLEHGLDSVEHIPVESTAKAAILAAKDKNSAAICSHIAAKLYDIPMLFENIEDLHNNMTRFIILSDFTNDASGNDKTSIYVQLKESQKAGSLATFLADFEENGVNLTKIESRPSRDNGLFTYSFFIDFLAHIDDENVKNALRAHVNEVTWLGSYARGDIEI